MSNIEYLAKEINSRYGNIKRARNCFLYTARGVRLTDMYQEGGRAILGWGGGSAFTIFPVGFLGTSAKITLRGRL